MATRLGIELSPTACRIVELDSSASGEGNTRVRSFAMLPPSGPQTQATLDGFRRRRAAVVVWGGRTEHRQVVVTAGSYESMRAEALAGLSALGVPTHGVWADIAVGPALEDDAARRTVMVSMASAVDMADALRPVRDAGIRLRTVTTPADALRSIGRWRPSLSRPDAIEAYVAFDEEVTCVALVRRGMLLGARNLPWGFVEANYVGSELRSRDDIATRLAEALEEFVAAAGGPQAAMGQVCLCGGLPDLRSLSVMLMERLDVEVEPLDSLFGIDAMRLPAAADEFRERGAELRLAWSAAADWPPMINLLRARRRQTSSAWLARAAVAAGAVAGLSGAWWSVDQSHRWSGRTTQSPVMVAKPRAGTIRPPVNLPQSAPPGGVQPRAPAEMPLPVPSEPSPAAPRLGTSGAVSQPSPVGEPFDAELRSILYSADRQLAIVDDRVVGVGDEVRGARVVQITETAVMLRDGQGRLRRLALGTEGR